MQEYILGPVVWWYRYIIGDVFGFVRSQLFFILVRTRTWPMLRNIYKPLYQDSSVSGRLIGFFIRFWWIFFGTLISIIYMIPFVVILLFLILIPLAPVVQIIIYLS